MSANLIDRFHRSLYAVLSEELSNRISKLANGSAALVQGDTATVAEKYSAQVAYIKALSDVLDKCRELEADMYGSPSGFRADV
jgi:hypothetical protein